MSKDRKRDVFEFAVEKSIPIPPPRKGSRPLKYPWGTMEVGDSIFVAGDLNIRESARSAAYSYGQRKKKTFETRSADDDSGIRIWRTK